jgi:chromosome segregation ATPase
MGKQTTLDGLAAYIDDVVSKVGRARKELAEVQVGFNSAYVEWKAQHDATLEQLVQDIILKLDEVGTALRARIDKRLIEEQRIIAERRTELDEQIIPETRAQADGMLKEGQLITTQLRNTNPQLDEREEKLKARRAELQAELAQLNQQIKRLSGCFTVVFNFPKINRLDRQRQRVIGQLETLQQDLRDVREEWQQLQQEKGSQRADLQTQWQRATLRLAELEAERDFLSEETNREDLARGRAVRHVVDNLKEPIACAVPDTKAQLDHMVALNIQTDDYEEGLASVASLIALIDGVMEGLRRFAESVQGLREEQRMHSAYLPRLEITVPDRVLGFNAQWDKLAAAVRDDARLAAHPAEFVAAIRPPIEDDLTEANIKGMFESLGQALTSATRSWRG